MATIPGTNYSAASPDFIRARRRGEGLSMSTAAFVPLKYELGDAFQPEISTSEQYY